MEVWNGIGKKSLVWNGIWNGRFLVMEMEWKKIASMECEKIVFYCIPYHALTRTTLSGTSLCCCWRCTKLIQAKVLHCCGVSKGSALRLRLTGSIVQPLSCYDLLTYKGIGSNYLSFVVTSMLVFHIATG